MGSDERFAGFMRSLVATVELRDRAATQGCFVEFVVLSAALIDGILRIGLSLRHQLDTGTGEVLLDLLHQGESDAAVTERTVFRRAREAGVIDGSLLDELNGLYGERNRVVHRYVISSITTKDILDIALRYEAATDRVGDAIAALEDEQVRRGVGMTTEGAAPGIAEVLDFAAGKHGDPGLAEALREALPPR